MIFGIASGEQVLCDPIEYDKQRFSEMLNRLGGLTNELPDSTDDIKGPVTAGVLRVLPGRATFPRPPKEHIYTPELGAWAVVGNFIERTVIWHLMPLEQARKALLGVLANRRWEVETGGITLANGTEVLTGTSDQARLAATYSRLKAGTITETRWKFANGWRWVTAADLQLVDEAQAAHVDACFRAEAEVDELINSSNIEALKELDVIAEFNARLAAITSPATT